MATEQPDQGAVQTPIDPMGLEEWLSLTPNLRLQRLFEALAPLPEGQSLVEQKLKNNVLMAPFGKAAPFTLAQDYSRVLSLNTEIECVSPVNITAPAMIASPAHVIFSGCYFIRAKGSGGDAINNTAATVDVNVVGSIAVGYADFGNTTDTASFV